MRLTETQRRFRQAMAKNKDNDSGYDGYLNRKPVSPRKSNWVRALIFYSIIVYLAILVIHIGFSHPSTVQTAPSGQAIAPSVQVTAPTGQLSAQSVQPEQWGASLQTGIAIPTYSGDGDQASDESFYWQYGGKNYSWSISVPAGLLTYDRQISSFMNTYFQSNGNIQAVTNHSQSMTQNMMSMIVACTARGNNNYVAWIDEPYNSAWIANISQDLADSAHNDGYDYYQEADYILSFIGSAIPYNATAFPELPAQTMIDSGDCKDKSILYASLIGHEQMIYW
jgi:hypothetical protein